MILISYVDKMRNCVVCGEEFSQDDDIVVCPECGAPHHRECWQAEGKCHFHDTHGTEQQWHPEDEKEESAPLAEELPHPEESVKTLFYMNGLAMTRCPSCGKMTRVYPTDTTCNHCGHPIEGMPALAQPILQNNPFTATDWKTQDPIDGIEAKKFARLVVQKAGYYLPRFRALKGEGKRVVSWNWAAFLLSPYWFAFRKCYLWAIFAGFFDLLSVVFLVPFYQAAAPYLAEGYEAYMQAWPQIANEISVFALGMAFFSLLILIARSVLFGLLGNYIYKKDCMRRIEKLDALSPDEANAMAFRLGGVNVFMPVVFYYLINIAKNLIMTFLY